MTTTATRAASATYVRTIRDRLQLAETHTDHAAIVTDIDTMIASAGAALLTDSQLRNLQRMRERADERADPIRSPDAGATHDLRPTPVEPATVEPAPAPTPKPKAAPAKPKPKPTPTQPPKSKRPTPRKRRRRARYNHNPRWNSILRAALEPLFALGISGAAIAILALTLHHIAAHAH
jgi:hypothetical protein